MEMNNSAYPELINQEIDWLPMDTKQLYKHNLKQNAQELSPWIDNPFTYKFNSKGFRCKEFDAEDNVVFLGCSYTIGIGLPIQHTWPTLVAHELDLACYNLGLGGGSWDSIYRIGSYWIEKLNPKFVFILEPPSIRYEVIPYGNVSIHEHHVFENTLWENLFRYEQNYKLNKQKNVTALKTFHNNMYIIDNDRDWFMNNHVDTARDLVHPGIQTNQRLKEKVLAVLDNK